MFSVLVESYWAFLNILLSVRPPIFVLHSIHDIRFLGEKRSIDNLFSPV